LYHYIINSIVIKEFRDEDNEMTKKTINIDENGDMNCFDRIFLLRHKKCNSVNCDRECKHITKGENEDWFYCDKHFFEKVRKGEIEHHRYFSFRYELAKLLVNLGVVKE